MVGSILGPGTIFLMLIGAFVSAFDLSPWSSLLWNLVPVTIFMLVCFFVKEDEAQVNFIQNFFHFYFQNIILKGFLFIL